METTTQSNYLFDASEEECIADLKKEVMEKANYNLRQILALTKKMRKQVRTSSTDEYGEPIEDWDKISTKELINFFTAGSAWNFYSTPIRMQAFIESSLADVLYKYQFNTILTDLEGTVAQKNAMAELKTQDERFAAQFRKLYTDYVTETLKSFDLYLRRIERIINFRQVEERMNPNKKPSSGDVNPFN